MTKQSKYPLTSMHWGTYRVETDNGKVKALHGFEEDDDVSPIGPGVLDVLDGPSRITAPMVRQSYLESGPGSANEKRGADPFVEVSWERATGLVADELTRVKQQYGNQAIFAGSYGWSSAGRFHHAQSQIHRFLNCVGGYTASKDTYSFAAGEVVLPHVMGSLYDLLAYGTSWPSVIDNSDLVVAFGGIPIKNGQINSGGVGRHVQREHLTAAKEAGVEFINISPLRSDLEGFVDSQWLAARPSTDAAIMLGLAYVLYSEKLHDPAFLEKYTHGFEEFLPYLLGESDGTPKTANWAAEISGLKAAEITALARRMASGRTMLSVSWSLTRQDHGEQPFWAAITLAAMLGQIGLPGGGVGFGYSATNSVGDHGTKIPGASLPQGEKPIKDTIPVARISDLLLHGGEEYDYNGQRFTYPDTHIVYWAGGNPFHHHQDINRMLQAWRKPATVIVHEWCWNGLAKHADIVLPCTLGLERNDIAISPRDPYVIAMQKVTEPPEGARHDYDILSDIAYKMGKGEVFTEGKDEGQWLDWIYQTTRENAAKRGVEMPTYDELKAKGWYRPEPPQEPIIMMKEFIDDPVKNPRPTPTGKIEIYSSTIASFGYEDCLGHPVWIEPYEWLGGDTIDYPLHLISNQPKTKLHSQLDHGSYSRSAKIKQREPIMLHPQDAHQRGLKEGDVVRVFNDRGACLAGVKLSDEIMPQVVQMSTGAWYDPLEPGVIGSLCKHGNPNVLTRDKGTSKLGQGPSAHTCLVEIELFEGELPALSAFDPPKIIKDHHSTLDSQVSPA
ncbi:MAG: biotin/methionine sulfoxide reductase [Saprospiraceae bacterium]